MPLNHGEGGCRCGAVSFEAGLESLACAQMPDGAPVVAINVNCLDGVGPGALESRQVDGRRH